jgi:hypothetical protein
MTSLDNQIKSLPGKLIDSNRPPNVTQDLQGRNEQGGMNTKVSMRIRPSSLRGQSQEQIFWEQPHAQNTTLYKEVNKVFKS